MAVEQIRSMEDFYNQIKEGVALVDFNAPWCAPCRLLEPIIEEVASRFEGRASILSVNVDEFQELASVLGIHSIPTLVVFKNNKELERIIGLQVGPLIAGALERACS